MPLAVNVGDVATPNVFVWAIAVAPPLAKMPLAPDAGAPKVTLVPESRLPYSSSPSRPKDSRTNSSLAHFAKHQRLL